MARGRSGANRGWRDKMKKHLADNPDVQAEVNRLTLKRLNNAKQELETASSAISAELTRLQSEIDNIETAG